jgi:glycosyltransferase involved in cell wall biosynthesis
VTASRLRVALVHDWLTGMRGGEYVLEAIAEMFPRSELYTLLYIPGKISPTLTTLKRHVSWLQRVPAAEKRYRHFLPLMPSMIERFDLTGCDLVISSSHCVAKGIRKPAGAVHVSYVHAPMRYMWDRFDDYFGPGRASAPVRLAAAAIRERMQAWDRRVSGEGNVDALVANSGFIARQVERAYGRAAQVIYPFADLSRFELPRKAGRNYLMVGAFAPYKKVELAIEAFNRLKLPLVIVGSGQEEAKLKRLAGPTVELVGALSNAAIADLYSKCRAFVFPGVEDFGITPLEAMASGAPVIAYGEGGAAETVTEKTGLLFKPQTVEALMDAVNRVESGEARFDEAACRARAREFSKDRFQREFAAAIRDAWRKAGKDPCALDERLRTSWAAAAAEL